MSILLTRQAPGARALRHDPLICLIDGVTPCDACRPAHQAALHQFSALNAKMKARAQRCATAERFAHETAITLAELAEALLPELIPGILEAVRNLLAKERGRRE